MKHFHILLLSLFTLSASHAFAFLPPHDTIQDVSLRILGFDEQSTAAKLVVQKVDARKPLPVKLLLENQKKEEVSGRFRVWMNGDWTLSPSEELSLTLKPGEKRSLSYTATAKDSVLPALYPIHATFSFEESGKAYTLHPIALLTAEKENVAWIG